MPKSSTARVRSPASVPPAAPTLPFPAAELVDDDPLTGLLEQFGGASGYRVRMERIGDKGKPAYLTTFPFTLDLIDDVKAEYGGGTYRGRVVDGDSHYIAGGSISFSIDGPPLMPSTSPPTPAAAPAAAALTAPVRDNAADLDAIADRVAARLAREQAPARSALDVVALITAVSPIVLELIKGARPKGVTIEDVRQLLDAKGGTAGTAKDMIASLKELLEVRELLGSDREPDAVSQAVATFAPILERALSPGASSSPAAPTALPAAGASSPSSTGQQEPMTAPLWVTRLSAHVDQLVRVAAEGGEPRQLAIGIISYFMLPADKGLLRELVAQEDAEAQILAAFPKLVPYREWLADFVDESRYTFGLLVDDEPATTPPAAAPVKPPTARKR